MTRNGRQDPSSRRTRRADPAGVARAARIVPIACIAVGALVAGCDPTPQPSPNYDTDYRLVFPVLATGPATIDGLATDPAWSNGFRFVMEDGGSFPAATLRGVADAAAIYLYAEVEDTGFEESDVVVIGLNPDNAGTNYRRIHVFPCKPTGVCPANGDSVNAQVDYATGSFGPAYTWTAASAAAANIEAKSATATAGSVVRWSVEVKIPRGAPFNFVNTNFFGFFVAVARTDPDVGLAGTATQYTWIPGKFVGGGSEDDVLTVLETGTPVPGDWGNATLSPQFGNGVTISGSDIYTGNPNTGQIEINGPNTFFAKAANYLSTGGTLTTAEDVVATFKIANFGLPSGWTNIPVGGNPTAAADIAPTSVHTFATQAWNLTPQQKADYEANNHQCIRVDLSSTNPATVFLNSSAQRNMDFVETFSPFQRRATLDTRGRETPGGPTTNVTLRETFANFDPGLTWTTEIGGAGRLKERTYEARVTPGGAQTLDITVDPPTLRLREDSLSMAPGTGGRERPAMAFAVEPNEVLTIIADGTLEIDGQQVTAVGMPPRGEGRERNGRRTGELIGSFDQFQTTVHLGGASTIKVPANARRLDLKIDADSADYAKQRGNGYRIQVVRSRAEPWMVVANPELARPTRGGDVHVTLGANLPTWLLRGERDTGRYLRVGNRTFRVHEPIGTFGYMVRRIGGRPRTPPR